MSKWVFRPNQATGVDRKLTLFPVSNFNQRGYRWYVRCTDVAGWYVRCTDVAGWYVRCSYVAGWYVRCTDVAGWYVRCSYVAGWRFHVIVKCT